MPEEIEEIKNLKAEGITLKEEDIMWPEPSGEQVALWQELEKNITEKTLERENLFGSLAKDIRGLLASESISDKLVKMSRYNLTRDQIIALARYIKSLFIDISKEEIETPQLINSLRLEIDIDPEKAQAIFRDINNEILLPALKNIPGESEPSKQTPPPKASPAPKPKDERIIDLKNLNRE